MGSSLYSVLYIIYGTAGEIVYGMAHYKSTASKEVFGIFIKDTQQFADGECKDITACM